MAQEGFAADVELLTTTGLVNGDSLTTQPTLSTTATTGMRRGRIDQHQRGDGFVQLHHQVRQRHADRRRGCYGRRLRFGLVDVPLEQRPNSGRIAATDILYGVPNTGLIPLSGDWTGDGIDSIGLYDPTTSDFYLRTSNSSGIADTVVCFGAAGCGFTPIVGNWSGDGIDTVGLYDPTHSVFYLRDSNTTGFADTVVVYGAAGGGYTPIVGDWTGSGAPTRSVSMTRPTLCSISETAIRRALPTRLLRTPRPPVPPPPSPAIGVGVAMTPSAYTTRPRRRSI